MDLETLLSRIPTDAHEQLGKCKFRQTYEIEKLDIRNTEYWHVLLLSRHIGIHRPKGHLCNWVARILTKDKRYVQKCLGPALDTGRGRPLKYYEAVDLAFEWFRDPKTKRIAHTAKPVGRTDRISVCPIGDVYTVGHALRDYTEWTEIARSAGGHYNNLILINYHLVPDFANIPLEEFSVKDLSRLAKRVLETPPRSGFQARQKSIPVHKMQPEELIRRKRTFNVLVGILRMAFRHAWDNGHIDSERPWRCLRRISVVHSPRTIFLNRDECHRLMDACTPALRKIVQAALYSGCRVGELGNLRVENVGYQVFGLRIEAFKRHPARYVFLPDEGMAFFLSCCEGKSPSDHVFRSDMGKVWKKQHNTLFKRAVSIAGLPSKFVFHGLRHTYASELVRAGVPLEVVAKQLGHVDTKAVSITYGHLAEHFREAQIRERFLPLDEEQRKEAARRKPQLDKIWQTCQRTDWREYGRIEKVTSTPAKSVCGTHKDILEVFGAAE